MLGTYKNLKVYLCENGHTKLVELSSQPDTCKICGSKKFDLVGMETVPLVEKNNVT